MITCKARDLAALAHLGVWEPNQYSEACNT